MTELADLKKEYILVQEVNSSQFLGGFFKQDPSNEKIKRVKQHPIMTYRQRAS